MNSFERLCSPSLLTTVNTRLIDEFTNRRLSEKVSPHTVNKNLAHLRTMIRFAHRWGYLPVWPEIRLLATPELERRAIDAETFERILEATEQLDQLSRTAPRSEWWRAFLCVAYMAGLRWGEILDLKWANLKLTSSPTLKVWNQKKRRFDQLPIARPLSEQLERWLSVSEKVDDSNLVFPHSCHPRTLTAAWERLQAWAEIEEPYRFHHLRDSCCTNLVASGTEAPTLMKLARHKSLATTMKYFRAGQMKPIGRLWTKRSPLWIDHGASQDRPVSF